MRRPYGLRSTKGEKFCIEFMEINGRIIPKAPKVHDQGHAIFNRIYTPLIKPLLLYYCPGRQIKQPELYPLSFFQAYQVIWLGMAVVTHHKMEMVHKELGILGPESTSKLQRLHVIYCIHGFSPSVHN